MKFNQTCRLFTNFVLLAFLVFLTAISLNAQNRQLTQKKPDISKAARIALVIGNGEYTNARKLTNPVNDANDMAKTLNELGFEVISGTNLNLQQMTEKVREFGDKLKVSGGVGLFYYAGHGIQVNGRNYLIPVNADITREDEIDFAALNFDLILRKLATANNGLNIVVLDACRNNPFARSWSRDAGDGGLAQVTAPTGTFIAYATSPDRTASDGTGRNGLYTAELLKHIKQPNLKIEEAFKQVTIAVDQKSDGKQVPWTSSSLRGEFYFLFDKSLAVNSPKPTAEKLPSAEQVFEKYIQAIGGKTAIQKFQSVIMVGELEQISNNEKKTGKITRIAKFPNKYFLEMKIADTIIHQEGFDGETGWIRDFTGVRK